MDRKERAEFGCPAVQFTFPAQHHTYLLLRELQHNCAELYFIFRCKLLFLSGHAYCVGVLYCFDIMLDLHCVGPFCNTLGCIVALYREAGRLIENKQGAEVQKIGGPSEYLAPTVPPQIALRRVLLFLDQLLLLGRNKI